MSRREKAGHHPQGFATARHSRAHRPDRQVDDRGRLLVAHSLQTDEQDYRSLLLRQFGKRPLQIAQLELHPLRWGERAAGVRIQPSVVSALPHVPASKTDMLIVQYREQPSAKIGLWIPQVDLAQGPGEAVLDEVICCDRISRQLSRITFQPGKQCRNVSVQRIVRSLLAAGTALPCRLATATSSPCIHSLGLHTHRRAPSFSICWAPIPDPGKCMTASAPRARFNRSIWSRGVKSGKSR